ncbi:MAG: RNA polymerase sigma factor [Acidobacteria bacterium]|nr:RNA polymerase sigma factor [Acidobacteriota bacterium]
MIDSEARAACYQRCLPELVCFATRMVARDVIAEELVQDAAIRLMQADALPKDEDQVRAWLFRVVSNLAIDHLRRHSTWRELVLVETRERAGADASFLSYSSALRGTPETRAIAREHLAVCFACTLRNLPPNHAAAILLREVHGFSIGETAEILSASAVQVKNWLQYGRRTLEDRYGHTCALVAKQGVCHQCVELDGFFNGQSRDPLAGTDRSLDARLALLRETREQALGPWHRRMMRLVDDVLEGAG